MNSRPLEDTAEDGQHEPDPVGPTNELPPNPDRVIGVKFGQPLKNQILSDWWL